MLCINLCNDYTSLHLKWNKYFQGFGIFFFCSFAFERLAVTVALRNVFAVTAPF